MEKLTILLLPALFIIQNEVQASNILFFHLMGSHSHRTSIWPLAEKLADQGHNLTYIFPLPRKKDNLHPAIEEIIPSKMVPILEREIQDYDIKFRLNNSNHLVVQRAFSICFDLCKAFYDSPEIQEWMSRPNLHYDLVMIDSSLGECIYGMVKKLRTKHVIFVPTYVPSHWDGFGIVPESSSVPPTMKFFGQPPKPTEMGFFGRLLSTVEPLLWRLGYWDYLGKVERLIIERMNMTDLPPLENFVTDASLVLANAHFVEEYPIALPPFIQSYSGLWCSKEKMKQRKPLPNKLEKFVGAEDIDGFFYFSFGSAVSVSSMPLEIRNKFFEAIAAFPKLKFFWRWNGPVPEDKPENLWLQNWFPQNDVLSHPKIKGFMTQAGRPSTTEALCHGVPLITVPVFADQDYNADRLEHVGAAINLDITTITTDSLKDAIKDLAYNETHKKRMSQLSAIYKDRPIDPLDNALYWTEYVLRHDTSLLKPLGIHQTWYQRRLLDVYLVICGAILILFAVIISFFVLACRFTMRVIGGHNTVQIKKQKFE